MPADALYRFVRPALFRLDAERAHQLGLRFAERIGRDTGLCELVRSWYAPPADPRLATQCLGLRFSNPLGLAAGLDKNGVGVDFFAALGFGCLELGTVTPGDGQAGNDPPRLARLPKIGALVNRLGFPNLGAEALVDRIRGSSAKIPIGANLGKAKLTPLAAATGDYLDGLRTVWPAVDYVVINVSSPNTPGLRGLQAIGSLAPILTAVLGENRRLASENARREKPILLKLSPDLSDRDLDAIADLCLALGVHGLIATNTTLAVEGLAAPIEGGISGAPLRARALACTRRLFAHTAGRLPIIGVGGIQTAEDAYLRIRAGATLVQIYTALVYEGPGLVASLLHGLLRLLTRDGFANVGAAVGADVGGAVTRPPSYAK